MKLRTAVEFHDCLDTDMAWRLREVADIRTAIKSSVKLSRRTLIRAGVPLIYAHWEGFVKISAQALLNYVSCQGKKYRELSLCFSLHGLATEIDQLIDSKKHDKRIASLNFIIHGSDRKANYSWKDKIKTNSNLNSEVFQSIAAAVGLNTKRYESRYAMINEQLLKRRNEIAHGEWVELDYAGFDSLALETLTLMRWFKDDLQNCVARKSYLAVP